MLSLHFEISIAKSNAVYLCFTKTERSGWTLLCVCVAVAEPIIGISLDAIRSEQSLSFSLLAPLSDLCRRGCDVYSARGIGVRALLLGLLLPWIASIYLVWQVWQPIAGSAVTGRPLRPCRVT